MRPRTPFREDEVIDVDALSSSEESNAEDSSGFDEPRSLERERGTPLEQVAPYENQYDGIIRQCEGAHRKQRREESTSEEPDESYQACEDSQAEQDDETHVKPRPLRFAQRKEYAEDPEEEEDDRRMSQQEQDTLPQNGGHREAPDEEVPEIIIIEEDEDLEMLKKSKKGSHQSEEVLPDKQSEVAIPKMLEDQTLENVLDLEAIFEELEERLSDSIARKSSKASDFIMKNVPSKRDFCKLFAEKEYVDVEDLLTEFHSEVLEKVSATLVENAMKDVAVFVGREEKEFTEHVYNFVEADLPRCSASVKKIMLRIIDTEIRNARHKHARKEQP